MRYGMGKDLDDNIQSTFGNILRTYRLQQQLSQEDLAERARLDCTYISQMERGLKSPSFRTLIALARALHVKASVLVADVEKELEKHTTMRN